MSQLALKAIVSGVIVAAASELARRSPLAGAILVSLPLTSILALVWLYVDSADAGEVRDLSWSILWVAPPSVVFFVALALLLKLRWGVPMALLAAAAATAVAYPLWVIAARRMGVDL